MWFQAWLYTIGLGPGTTIGRDDIGGYGNDTK